MKRTRAADASISPPPSRRRRLDDSTTATPLLDSHQNGIQILSWNVNGIGHLLPSREQKITSFFKNFAPEANEKANYCRPLREVLRCHDFPEVVCLQEVKIKNGDTATMKRLQDAANRAPSSSSSSTAPERNVDPSTSVQEKDGNTEEVVYQAHFSLPRDMFNARGFGGKLYGVCTLVSSSFSARYPCKTDSVDWDLEGRLLVTVLESPKVVFINGYWPNGTDFAYKDSLTGAVSGTRHQFKRLFHEKLLKTVKDWEAKEYDVIMVGDMNISPSPIDGFPGIRTAAEHITNRADFNAKFLSEQGWNGVDTWRYCHGDKKGYTYHGEAVADWGRSCDRVDLGLVSPGITAKGALKGADIWESAVDRGGSDHVPIGVWLNLEQLSGKEQLENKFREMGDSR